MEQLKREIAEIIGEFPGRAGIEIYFLNQGKRMSFKGNERFHAASIIKLPILYEALKQVKEKRVKLEAKFSLPEEEIVGGAGVLQLLQPGLNLTLLDLLYLMTCVSDNTATNMVIDIIGLDSVNKRLEELGCRDTLLARKLMKVIPGVYSYTSPRDTVIVLEKIYSEFYHEAMPILKKQQFNDCLSRDNRFCKACGELIGGDFKCSTCEKTVNEIEIEQPVFAHKTGEVTGVIHDSGIWEFPGETVIMAVLTDNLPDNKIGNDFQSQIGKIINKFFK